jgi:hypothetical protein
MSVEQDTLPGIPGQVNTFSQPLRIFTSTLCQFGIGGVGTPCGKPQATAFDLAGVERALLPVALTLTLFLILI